MTNPPDALAHDPSYPIGRFLRPERYTAADRTAHVERIGAQPAQLADALDGLDEQDFEAPYRPNGWTVGQLVHHMADSHVNAYVRHKLTITEKSPPPIKAYDENAWAKLADANGPAAEFDAGLPGAEAGLIDPFGIDPHTFPTWDNPTPSNATIVPTQKSDAETTEVSARDGFEAARRATERFRLQSAGRGLSMAVIDGRTYRIGDALEGADGMRFVLREVLEGAAVLEHERFLVEGARSDWFLAECQNFVARTLRRFDNTSKSLFAIVKPGHCFAGVLFELVLAADRSFMLADEDGQNTLSLSGAQAGAFPMATGTTRLKLRYPGDDKAVAAVLEAAEEGPITGEGADELGLVTAAPDDIDWDDEVRIAVEERISLSPDALTGMEQNLRFGGAESAETKIYGRLSAWQNWIFQRPNAVGEHGALSLFGHPERPVFDYRRT
jgi:hypothetical protein